MTDRFVATPLLGARFDLSAARAPDGVGRGEGAVPAAGVRTTTDADLRDVRLVRMQVAAEFGPLAPYLMGSDVTDLFINGDAGLWVDRGAGLERDRARGRWPNGRFANWPFG